MRKREREAVISDLRTIARLLAKGESPGSADCLIERVAMALHDDQKRGAKRAFHLGCKVGAARALARGKDKASNEGARECVTELVQALTPKPRAAKGRKKGAE